MFVFEQRVADCSLEELLIEVLVRIKETNGMEFVAQTLAREVVGSINAEMAVCTVV